MFEVRGSGYLFYCVVGKLFGQDAAQSIAKLFAGNFPGGGDKIEAHHFKAFRLGTPKTLHGKCEASLGMIGDGQDATGNVAVIRPQM